MRIDAFTHWQNCWVSYLKKYFDTTAHDLRWHVGRITNISGIKDIGLFCWANESIEELTKRHIKACKKYVVFVRSYEIFFGHIQNIKWDAVDDAIFVNRKFYDEFKDKLPCRVHHLSNAIDLDEWKFQEDHGKTFNQKFRVAMVCNLNHKKGINMLPQLIYELQKIDTRYEIFIAGTSQEPRYTMYLANVLDAMGLINKVHFSGQIKDIKGWLSDKDYLFTCSVTEGMPNNVIEAMSLGIKPVVHSWVGAEHDFPSNTIWHGIMDAVKMITETNYDSEVYRQYAEDNFDMWKVYPKLEQILIGDLSDADENANSEFLQKSA